jgi:aminocarboxymuconate-semialdehyde decarboxylase
MRIDVHAHYMPADLAEAFGRLGGRPIRMHHPAEMDERLADMDAAGVDRQILSLGALHPYWDGTAAAVEGAQAANTVYREVMAEHPRRFGAFGAVPLPHGPEAAREAVRCLDERGFAGIGLGCSAAGRPLDDPEFAPLWSELDRRQAVVYLHPGVANQLAVGVADYPMLLGPVFGSPAEIAVAAVRLVLRGVTTAYPGIRFLLGAMGGTLPFQWHKLLHSASFTSHTGAEPNLARLEEELRRFHYDTSSIDDACVLAARQAGIVDRLVFGSDAPWGTATASVETIDGCDLLTAEEKAGILGHRARRLLRTED